MKLSDQVCTLEQAKKLSELGVLQGASIFFYDGWCSDKNSLKFNSHNSDGFYKDSLSCFSAFTVSELGIMLPEYIETHRSDHGKTRWYCGKLELQDGDSWQCNDTQAQCMASYLLQLLEQDLIKVEEVNKRLKQ